MDNSIQVTDNNCLVVASELVARLRNKTFSIESFETNIYPRPVAKVVSGLRLYDEDPIPGFDPALGYHFESDVLTILFSSKRKLEWNLSTDKVTIIFHEDGRITIEKSLLNAIFYTIVIRF
ncbi:hypothetical protein GW844_03620 [bacterium]|nr:hypothetical protein [bacterium]